MTRCQRLLSFAMFFACAIQPRCAQAQELSRASIGLIDDLPQLGRLSVATSTGTSITTSVATSVAWDTTTCWGHVPDHAIPIGSSPPYLPSGRVRRSQPESSRAWDSVEEIVRLIYVAGMVFIVGMFLGFCAGKTVHAKARLWFCRVCGQIGATTRGLEFEEVEHMLASGCPGDLVENWPRLAS